jgi:hypothetical protein
MKRTLTAALFVLTLSAPALADTVPEGVKLSAYQPVGNGDPNAISCYQARMPTKHLECARNSQWARINRQLGNAPNTSFAAGTAFGDRSPGAAGGAVSGRN